MVVVLSAAAAAKARGPRKAVQRLHFETAQVVQKQRAKRSRCTASEQKVRVASESDKPQKVPVQDADERYRLVEKKGRRTVHLNAVLASGAADFDRAPGREQYEDGEAGADQQEKDCNAYVDRDFDDAGAEVRSLDQRDRKVGLFGDWLETAGHDKYLEWVCW